MPAPMATSSTRSAAFAMLCLIWGSTWLAIRIGLEGAPPFLSASLRFAVASIVLVLLAVVFRSKWPQNRTEWALVGFVGIVLFTGDYGLIYWGENNGVPSGLSAILFATFPLQTALVANAFLKAERLTLQKFLGIAVGFGGVVLIFRSQLGTAGLAQVFPMLLDVLGAACAAFGAVAVKRWGHDTEPISFNAASMAVGAGALAGVSLIAREPWTVPTWPQGLGAILYLAIAGSVVTFVAWQWLLKELQATLLSDIALGIPVVRHAAPPLGAVAERNDEGLLVSFRSRFREVLDQLHERRDLFRRRLDPTAAHLLGDREGPGVFSEHEGALPPQFLRLHRLVRRGVLDHAVRMDAGFVCKGVVADERLVHSDRDPAQRLHELGQLVDPRDVDPRVVAVQRLERQDEFLEARVAGAFPEAIHACVGHGDAGLHRREAIRDRESEVVVSVERQLGRLQSALQLLEEPRDAGWRHHADRVAHHGAVGSRRGARIVQIHDEVEVRAECVFGHERHVDAMGDRILRLPDGGLFHLLARHRELVLDVDVGSGGEQRNLIDVAGDACLHVLPHGPRRGHDGRIESRVRDHPDAARLLARDDRNPDVHHRNVDLVQDAGDPHLLLRRVRDPGRLFAVPQGLLPDPDPLRDPRRQARLDEVVVDQAFLRDAAPPLFARVKPRHDLKLSRGGVYRRHGRSRGNAPTDQVRPRVRGLVSGERPSAGDRPLLGLRGGRLHPNARGAGPAERMGVRSETRRDFRGHLRPRSARFVREGPSGRMGRRSRR